MNHWDDLSPRQRRRKKRAMLRQGLLAACVLLAAAGAGLLIFLLAAPPEAPSEPDSTEYQQVVALPDPTSPSQPPSQAPTQPPAPAGPAHTTARTVQLGDAAGSGHAVFVDVETNTVLAEKDSHVAVYPASMTKVLTLLVAAEAIDDPDAPFTMTQEIIDPHYRAGATITGYRSGDVCTLRDLFYGAGLRSAADATTALAIAAAGSEAAFVEKMNEKCRQLGLSDSAVFTNASGMFDKSHTCTLRDMAAIMAAAMENDLVRQVLSQESYRTAPTEKEPEGLVFHNKYLGWFLEKQPEGAQVLACKSGYVAQALNCLVSYGENAQGRAFVCVIARAADAETMMGDHRMLYSTYGR